MNSIYFLGECMVELKSLNENTMHQSFAGDVYNSAVYLKRCFRDIETGLISAVGKDSLSSRMIAGFEKEGINSKYVFRHESLAPGMYYIETDSAGERRFTYWRNQSAARKIVSFLDDDVLNQLIDCDYFFFSGISLAVIEPYQRKLFWEKLEKLKRFGVKIVFDPNYRARLWGAEREAVDNFNTAFKLADIVLPGVEDLEMLYSIDNAHDAVAYCTSMGATEVVVKNGASSVLTYCNGIVAEHVITPVGNVVDTTSAGDAFNGVYLGARLSGFDVSHAVAQAAKAAGIVIQFPGAIAPESGFMRLFESG